MFVVAVVHATLMILKARNEERFLLDLHGEAYARYCARTGRFLPRAAARHPA
jgi:protein-S-isoprenylcysteine O-methyltransferase Ste14